MAIPVFDDIALYDVTGLTTGGVAATVPRELTDPGDAGAIPITASGVCHLVTAGAETRTVADPTQVGLQLTLYFLTDGGDCVVTFASPVNVTGNNTATYADAGDYQHLVSVRDGASSFRWAEVKNDGAALSTV